MRAIAIIPRSGREVGRELRDAITCLRSAGIHAHDCAIGQAFALMWVDEAITFGAVDTLRDAGLQAAALTDTEEPD
jgi:hypothetical protein